MCICVGGRVCLLAYYNITLIVSVVGQDEMNETRDVCLVYSSKIAGVEKERKISH